MVVLPRFAAEALALDAVFHARLIRALVVRPDAALLAPSLLPFTSLFVAESHDRLRESLPGFRVEPVGVMELIRPARHRTKLLLSRKDHLTEMVAKYGSIAAQERKYFSTLHSGILAPLKRLVQPDLGLCTVAGHIFSTTHATRFICGIETHNPRFVRSTSFVVSSYCAQLLATFAPNVKVLAFEPHKLARVEQMDIKSVALYRRGALGTVSEEWAAVLTMILANLNFVRHVLSVLVPGDLPTMLKLRTLQAFNAIHSIRRIQDRLRGDNQLPSRAATVLARAISSPEAKWLRTRHDLRDLLIHFRPRNITPVHFEISYADAIEVFGGATSAELAITASTILRHLTETLTEGFNLDANSFWYGRLPRKGTG